jgi:hypothetical protein
MNRPTLVLDDPLASRPPQQADPPRQPDPARQGHQATEPDPAGQTDQAATPGVVAIPNSPANPTPLRSVAEHDAQGTSRKRSGKPTRSRHPAPEAASAGLAPDSEARVWREWSGTETIKTMRLPDELVEELAERTTRLRLPLGITQAAALAHLLDRTDEEIVQLVERAEDARNTARRRRRRRT